MYLCIRLIVLCLVFLLPFHNLAVHCFSVPHVFSSFISPSCVNSHTRQTAESPRGGELMWQAVFTAHLTTQDTAGIGRRVRVVSWNCCLMDKKKIRKSYKLTCLFVYSVNPEVRLQNKFKTKSSHVWRTRFSRACQLGLCCLIESFTFCELKKETGGGGLRRCKP